MPEAMGKLLQDEGVNNIFAMAPNYQAGKDMVAGLQRYYKRDIAGQILFKLGQNDFAAEISQVRAANPKAVFIFAPGGMGINFMKQYAAAGLSKEIPVYSVFVVDYMTLKPHGENVVGTYHTNFWDVSSDNPANVKFKADFQKKYGYPASHYALQAYDAGLLIGSGLKAVNGNLDDKAGIMKAMEKADIDSPRGKFTYNSNHIPIQNFYKREVVKTGDGVEIKTSGVVFENHKDSYYQECKMPKM
jgi:branched-chain amino acid transport system substrate-binding protein